MSEHPAVLFLTAALDQAEELAEAGTPGPWEPEGDDPTDDEVFTVHNCEHGDLVGNPVAYVRSGMWRADEGRTQANMRLIALFADPVAVLGRVAADRQILAEHQPAQGVLVTAHEPCGDPGCNHTAWTPTCGTCAPERLNGGMEPWPCRTVLLLAEGYGWTGEAK